ncbi:class I SAM-dependent methyltransferase [Clostridia bacterium]|nr:class I SAM-dependent methyltransferase [Clostridia bacterium]
MRISSDKLFNRISPVYGLFYAKQGRYYSGAMELLQKELDLSLFERALDLGSGTGVLASVLEDTGLSVMGVDSAARMVELARKKAASDRVHFMEGNVLEGLPFGDKFFDVSFASYVAHGLVAEDRKKLYQEMSRITKHWVLFLDYSQERSLLTNIVEWLEGGDYFHFIQNAGREMEECAHQMQTCFTEVRIIPVAPRANWYMCRVGE